MGANDGRGGENGTTRGARLTRAILGSHRLRTLARKLEKWDRELAERFPDLPARGAHRFAERDRIRAEIARPFLSGRGAEIGAGAYPAVLPAGVECHYFDKRSAAEMQRYFGAASPPLERLHGMNDASEVFPEGADFIVAHNVLEHLMNPIATLLEWHRMLRDGGVAVVSVPQAGYGPDKRRLPVSFEHVLLDFLLERNGDEFDSREHVFAAMSGFDKGSFKGMDKIAQAQTAFRMTTDADLTKKDLYWHVHVFVPETLLQTVHVASAFDGRRIEVLELSHPTHEKPELRNEGEIILVYRVRRGRAEHPSEIEPAIASLDASLRSALEKLKALGRSAQ